MSTTTTDKRVCRKWTEEEDALILAAAEANRTESRTSPAYFEYVGEVGYCEHPDCKACQIIVPIVRNYVEANGEHQEIVAGCQSCGGPVREYHGNKRYANRLREVAKLIGRTYEAVAKRASRIGARSYHGRQRRLPMERKAS